MITRQEPGQESRDSPKFSARILCNQIQTHKTDKKLSFTLKFNVDHGAQGHFPQKNFPLSLLENLGFERAMAGGEYSMITRQEPGQESRDSPKSSARMLRNQIQTHKTDKKLPFS
jgi:hypothetical protein